MSLLATKAVWKHSQSKGGTRLVLLCIADHTDKRGLAWPGITTLARECNLSERMVQYCIAELIDTGELAVSRSAGRRRSNRYRVLLPGVQSEEKVKHTSSRVVVEAQAISPLDIEVVTQPTSSVVTQPTSSRVTKPIASLNRKDEPPVEQPLSSPKTMAAEPAAPRRRDYHWEALVHVFGGSPVSRMERNAWNAALANMREVSPDDIILAAGNWPNVMGATTMTPHGIAKYLSILLHGPQVNGRSNGVTVGMRHTKSITYSERPDITDSLEQIIRERDQN